MKIVANTRKLTKILKSSKKLKKYFGKNRANKIKNRIDEFNNAVTLQDISHNPPARCHLLQPHNKCRFAVSISRNYRIIFEGYLKDINNHYHLSSNKNRITVVQILAIEDYH